MFSRKPKSSEQLALSCDNARGPDGKRCYVIGDVHGRLDLLKSMLDSIEADIESLPQKRNFIVMLGDLIDRGPDSKGVIDLFLDARPSFAEFRFVAGNHEEGLLRGLTGEPHLLLDWLKHGGFQCALSYGASAAELHSSDVQALETTLLQCIPQRHIDFLKQFNDSISFGDYFLVHAGVRPGTPIERQAASDLHWIREPFLSSKEDLGAVVVHGHTIVDAPTEMFNRIALDTGAYSTGRLTSVCLEGVSRRYLTIEGDSDESHSISNWRQRNL